MQPFSTSLFIDDQRDNALSYLKLGAIKINNQLLLWFRHKSMPAFIFSSVRINAKIRFLYNSVNILIQPFI